MKHRGEIFLKKRRSRGFVSHLFLRDTIVDDDRTTSSIVKKAT
jgi:hypothetical protein